MTDDLEEVVARIIASDELHTKLRALVIVCGHDHIMGEVLRTPAGLVYCSGARIPVQIVEFPPGGRVARIVSSPIGPGHRHARSRVDAPGAESRVEWQQPAPKLLIDEIQVIASCECASASLQTERIRAAVPEHRNRRVPVDALRPLS